MKMVMCWSRVFSAGEMLPISSASAHDVIARPRSSPVSRRVPPPTDSLPHGDRPARAVLIQLSSAVVSLCKRGQGHSHVREKTIERLYSPFSQELCFCFARGFPPSSFTFSFVSLLALKYIHLTDV